MATILIADAERSIVQEWDRWAAKRGLPERGVHCVGHPLRDFDAFYQYLKTERYELLDYKTHSSNKPKQVRGWLRYHRCLVAD
jgi:hypothetical protein